MTGHLFTIFDTAIGRCGIVWGERGIISAAEDDSLVHSIDSVDERALSEVSKLVEVFSGRRVPPNKPIVGENVFTQTAGIHADGDMKGNLYESRLTPSRFGQHRTYAMGKLMGKASLEFNLERLHITLSPEQKQQLLARIVELGDHGQAVEHRDLERPTRPDGVDAALERLCHGTGLGGLPGLGVVPPLLEDLDLQDRGAGSGAAHGAALRGPGSGFGPPVAGRFPVARCQRVTEYPVVRHSGNG